MKVKYCFMCEGGTEHDYFMDLRASYRKKNPCGIISITDFYKTALDRDETDPCRLLKISKDYVNYSKGKITVDLMISLIFETAASRLEQCSKYNKISQYSEEMRKIKDEILQRYKSTGCIISMSECSSQEEILKKSVIKACSDVIQKKFGVNLKKILKPADLKIGTITKSDIICIVHDRDYNHDYINEKEYKKILSMIMEYNKKRENEYRLIITNPKFEFWILMHNKHLSLNKVELDNLIYDRTRSRKTDPSRYVDELVCSWNDNILTGKKKKDICFKEFSQYLEPNLDAAIKNSTSFGLTTNVIELEKSPGTNLGLLLEEILYGVKHDFSIKL